VVLFIALIVMVAMSLAAIALIRSVDTTSQVIGNLAFRQSSILPANWAIEHATAQLFSDAGNGATITDKTTTDLTQNYYATHNQTWDDKLGVPQPLQTTANVNAFFGAGGQKLPRDSAGNQITWVIERMCNPDIQAAHPEWIPAGNTTSQSWCEMMPPKVAPGTTIGDQGAPPLPQQAFYRVTVRVDGPTNTVSFVQAFLR
jgi:hypothetical protein